MEQVAKIGHTAQRLVNGVGDGPVDATARVMARNHVKQKIFDIAHDNYVEANALVGAYVPEPTVSKVTLTRSLLANTLKTGRRNAPPQVSYQKEFYDYNSGDNRTSGGPRMWVSFANKHLGGGFLGRGYVQEEIIAVEFYEMSQMIVENNIPLMAKNEAFLFTNLIRSSVSDPRSYGDYSKVHLERPSTIKVADFVSIDAPKRDDREDHYTYGELNHLAVKSLTGFVGCVEIGHSSVNTGNWGAGVFNNRRDVVYFIQYLSAWLAGLEEVHFWGYAPNEVGDIVDIIAEHTNLEKYYLAGLKLLFPHSTMSLETLYEM